MRQLQTESAFSKDLHALLFSCVIFGIFGLPKPVSAQESSTKISAQTEGSEKLNYTFGIRLKTTDMALLKETARLRPVLGLSYGKWRLGIGDGQDWLGFSQFGKEPSLSYQLLEKSNLTLGLSMRIHNVNTGEAYDVFENGKKTLHTRVMANHKINRRWSLGLDWTQDVLNKGDSSTINAGLSYAWPVFSQSELILNLGSTWATAEHWRNSEMLGASSTDNAPARTGFGKLNSGLTFKQSISRHWAWYSSFGVSRDIAELRKIQGSREVVTGQIGILYFQR